MIISTKEAVKKLLQGEVVALPTETVYGLGAIVTNENAIKKIFEIKNRPVINPLICHIHNVNLLQNYAYIEEYHYKFFKYWPGPLTILFRKKENISNIITANSEYCAFRIPDHPIFLKILKEVQYPVAAPSANPSGKISPVTPEMVLEYFNNRISVVDGGRCNIGLESTVIQVLEHNTIRILRPGKLTKEFFEKEGFTIIENNNSNNLNKSSVGLLSPGQLPRHYAPEVPLLLLDYNFIYDFKNTKDPYILLENIIKKYNKNSIIELNTYKNIGFLVYGNVPDFKNFINLSPNSDLEEIARNLFLKLKEMENVYNLIVAFEVKNKEIGIAINDRLHRASRWKIKKN